MERKFKALEEDDAVAYLVDDDANKACRLEGVTLSYNMFHSRSNKHMYELNELLEDARTLRGFGEYSLEKEDELKEELEKNK